MKFAAGTVDAQVLGKGRALVLCHSLLADRSSFNLVADRLAVNFKVVIPSLPGFPGSERVPGSLEAVADRMADAVRDVAGGDQAILLGNGYGGFVSLQLALRHPELVSRLVLVDAGAKFSEPGREAFRVMARAAAGNGLEAVADAAMRRLFAPDFIAANPALVTDRHERFLAIDPEVFITACQTLAQLDLISHLPNLSVPVLAVVGELDQATPPAMSAELVAHLPQASLLQLSGCAHVPQLQAPERFLEAVLPFLLDDE
jgi:3-oxoadipate enol-lactonase